MLTITTRRYFFTISFFNFFPQMKYLAVLVLFVLSCGPLVRAEVEKLEKEEVPVDEVHDEAVVNTKRLVKHTLISIPLMVDPKDPVNLRKRYCYCFQRRCNGKKFFKFLILSSFFPTFLPFFLSFSFFLSSNFLLFLSFLLSLLPPLFSSSSSSSFLLCLQYLDV